MRKIVNHLPRMTLTIDYNTVTFYFMEIYTLYNNVLNFFVCLHKREKTGHRPINVTD